MNRNNIFFGAFLALLFTLFLASVVFAAATTGIAKFTFSILDPEDPNDEFILNCDGTEIYLDGYYTMFVHTTTDNTGRIHSNVLSKYNNVFGMGPSGEPYRGQGMKRVAIISPEIDGNHQATNQTLIQNFKLMGPERDQHFYIKANMRWSLNEDGDFLLTFDRSSMICEPFP